LCWYCDVGACGASFSDHTSWSWWSPLSSSFMKNETTKVQYRSESVICRHWPQSVWPFFDGWHGSSLLASTPAAQHSALAAQNQIGGFQAISGSADT